MSVSSGWGRFTWGQANWNENQKFAEGWGAKTWNEQSWGDLNDVTVSVTGQEITSSELLNTAAEVVNDIYNQQLKAGIDLIPVNDFSFYDRVLDLCCFLGITPERFSQNVKPFFLDEYPLIFSRVKITFFTTASPESTKFTFSPRVLLIIFFNKG